MEGYPWLQFKWCTLNLAIVTKFAKPPNILVIRYYVGNIRWQNGFVFHMHAKYIAIEWLAN